MNTLYKDLRKVLDKKIGKIEEACLEEIRYVGKPSKRVKLEYYEDLRHRLDSYFIPLLKK